MRKLTYRDVLATLIVVAILIPFIGYSIRGSMPFIQDPRGMGGLGLAGALLAFAAFGRKAFGTGAFERITISLAVLTLGFALAAVIAENSWALLVPMVAGIVLVWALALAYDAGHLTPRRVSRHG